jgi:hypothetical protein
MFGVGFEIK